MAEPGLPDTETEGGREPSLNDHAKRHVDVSTTKIYNLNLSGVEGSGVEWSGAERSGVKRSGVE